ncbi:MAG: hypothetical protein OXI23_05355 [Gemmatimonadota bacterium]|nr:hypothetical protein [Gemmatimonadota bacterium]
MKTPSQILIVCACLLSPSVAFAQEAKSPKKAAFLSVLLPGLGERYAGGRKSAKFFLFTEGMFWTGVFAFKKLNTTRENTFRAYAAARAGATTEEKPNSHYDRLSSYNSIYDYNARLQYVEGTSVTPLPETPENFWEWDTPSSREHFRELRSKATWARTRSFLFVGALIFNRFASALNAASIAAKTRPIATVSPNTSGDLQVRLSVRF